MVICRENLLKIKVKNLEKIGLSLGLPAVNLHWNKV